jgi:hypothetical protein
MLSVIVAAGAEEGEGLTRLLTALTSAAVEGLVREVLIAGGGPAELLAVVREETGAVLAGTLMGAIAVARSDRLLVLTTECRPPSGWIFALAGHLRGGGGDGILSGEGGGFLRPAPYAVLIGREKARALLAPDLKRLRRVLGQRAHRIA